MLRVTSAAVCGFLLMTACATPRAPRLEGLGDHRFALTCSRPEARAFLDQGLRLTYAFDHGEALRAFEEAARLEPGCAMAYWGQALALGSDLDASMSPEAERRARIAIDHAIARSGTCTEKERALIDALSLRFLRAGGATSQERDAAYARAMERLAQRHPDDADLTTLATAASMQARPRDYWTKDGTPREGTLESVAALEAVLEKSPDHPGALHYYLHLVEASSDPDRGVPYAERLGGLMPSAGHMVHMPSHIYMRVGRYADASNANVSAILADEDYRTQCHAQGLLAVGGHPHHRHFLWSAATMEGRSGLALESAREVAEVVSSTGCCSASPLSAEDQRCTPVYALVRFGRWEELLAEPAPAHEARFASAMWHYGRGIALAALERPDEAEVELAELRVLSTDPGLAAERLNLDTAGDVLAIAQSCLSGEIAARRGRLDEAITLLREAVRLQDGLAYAEPPTWHYPVRQSLGAVLIEAGRLEEAEAVYREDLARWRENGWSLFGLARVLRLRGDGSAAREVEQRFQRAWKDADVQLSASVFR